MAFYILILILVKKIILNKIKFNLNLQIKNKKK